MSSQHQDEVERLQEQLRRERQRCQDDRAHYENEANQIRRIAQERAQAEIERIREEEENRRRVLMKKHAVNSNSILFFCGISVSLCLHDFGAHFKCLWIDVFRTS